MRAAEGPPNLPARAASGARRRTEPDTHYLMASFLYARLISSSPAPSCEAPAGLSARQPCQRGPGRKAISPPPPGSRAPPRGRASWLPMRCRCARSRRSGSPVPRRPGLGARSRAATLAMQRLWRARGAPQARLPGAPGANRRAFVAQQVAIAAVVAESFLGRLRVAPAGRGRLLSEGTEPTRSSLHTQEASSPFALPSLA
jgi:hypothetical protein